jgi:GR25 family glycosyltransferase involved in LPS biosynthesis
MTIRIIISFTFTQEQRALIPPGYTIHSTQEVSTLLPHDIWIQHTSWDTSFGGKNAEPSSLQMIHHPWNRRVWIRAEYPHNAQGIPDKNHPTLRRAREQGLVVVDSADDALLAAIMIGRGGGQGVFCPQHQRVISLARRDDRRSMMRNQWELAGQSLEHAVFQQAVEAKKAKQAEAACRESHLQALQSASIALEENPALGEWALILEDDAIWIEGREGQWPSQMPHPDTAIAYLGAAVHQWKQSQKDSSLIVNQAVEQTTGGSWEQVQAWYAHAYAVQKKFIPQIIDIVKKAPAKESIDTIYCMIVARKLRCEAWIPSLLTQAPGPSDIEQVSLDRRQKVLALDQLIREHRMNNGQEQVPAYVCLNLESRPDKRQWMEQEWGRVGIKPHWWIAKKDEEDPVRGCRQSHFAIWRAAVQSGLPWVVVVEDDVEFTGKVPDLTNVPGDWEILYLGGNTAHRFENAQWGNQDWMPVQSWSTYGYAIRTSFIESLEKQGVLDTVEGAIDQWLLEAIHPNARVYRQAHPWVIPRSGEEQSDCSGQTMNYEFLRQEQSSPESAQPAQPASQEKKKTVAGVSDGELPRVSLVTPTLKSRQWYLNALYCINQQDYPADLIEWVVVDEGNGELEMLLPEDARIRYVNVGDEERKVIYQEFVAKLRREEKERRATQDAKETGQVVELKNGKKLIAVSKETAPFRKKQRGKGKKRGMKQGGTVEAPGALLDFHRQTPWKEGEGDFWRSRLPMGMKRNLCVAQASHDIILHWDDDDWYPKTSVSQRVRALLESGKDIVGCTTIPCFDTTVCMSWMNVPPQTDALADRLSEATMAYRRSAWEERKFGAQVIGAEGASFVRGREDSFQEIPYEGVIVSLVHRGNLSTRKRPMGHEPNGWHFGALLDQEFTLMTNIENPEFKHPEWLRAFVLKPYLVE